MRPPFHYTNAAGLIGILSSESLYATDYRYLNDASEVGSIRAHIVPIFESEVGQIMRALTAKGLLKEEYYKELGSRVDQLEAESLYRALVRAIDNVSPFFVLSFCRHHDGTDEFENGLLSQWRAYADGGGFAIEFDEEKLDALAKQEKESFAYVGFKSDDVNYYAHDEVFNANDYKGVAGGMIRDIFVSIGKDISDIAGQKSVDEAVLAFAHTAPFLKHPGFCEEDEYRMVFVCLRATKIDAENKLPPKPVKVRNKDGLLVPYIELFETLDAALPIKSIIVGPHPLQARQEEALKMLLEYEGKEVPVRSSKIPYRK
jgi:Protein of unknown function (DUF2971)